MLCKCIFAKLIGAQSEDSPVSTVHLWDAANRDWRTQVSCLSQSPLRQLSGHEGCSALMRWPRSIGCVPAPLSRRFPPYLYHYCIPLLALHQRQIDRTYNIFTVLPSRCTRALSFFFPFHGPLHLVSSNGFAWRSSFKVSRCEMVQRLRKLSGSERLE